MGLASRSVSSIGCFRCFSGSTIASRTKAMESDSQSPRRSSNVTAGRSGSNPASAKAPPFSSRFVRPMPSLARRPLPKRSPPTAKQETMSNERFRERVHVLLVEDNPADADLIRETISGSRLDLTFETVGDGDRASDFLHRRGDYSSAARPDLVILDINLPRRDGWELLEEIRCDRVLRKVPVVVLTS